MADKAAQNVAVRLRTLEHTFFGGAGLTLLGFVIVGFAPTYFLAGVVAAKLPSLLVHLHAALFVGWVFLFLAQVGFAATGRIQWHRQLGALMTVWALVMVIVGPPVVVIALRRPRSGVDGQALFGDLGEIIAFAAFIGAALLRRRDAASHKRLMLLGTAIIMLPALARWPDWLPLSGFLILYLLTPLGLAVWDFSTRRRIHRATISGLAVMAVLFALTVVVPRTPLWVKITHFVQTV
jgi:hypothetical protein